MPRRHAAAGRVCEEDTMAGGALATLLERGLDTVQEHGSVPQGEARNDGAQHLNGDTVEDVAAARTSVSEKYDRAFLVTVIVIRRCTGTSVRKQGREQQRWWAGRRHQHPTISTELAASYRLMTDMDKSQRTAQDVVDRCVWFVGCDYPLCCATSGCNRFVSDGCNKRPRFPPRWLPF